MNSVLDKTITKAKVGKMHGIKHVCKNTLRILKAKFSGFLEMFPEHFTTGAG